MKQTLLCFSLSYLSYNNWQQGKTNMTTLRKIEKFIPATRDWTSFLLPTRFVKSSGGAKTYNLLRNLVAPANPSDKSYDELVRVMNEHQKPSVIMERYINSTKETDNHVSKFHFM